MKSRSLLLTLMALAAYSSAEALVIRHTDARLLHATPFTRLGEFFGCKPGFPMGVALQTSGDSKSGLYLVVETDTKLKKFPKGSTAVLEFIFEGDKAPREYTFALPESKSSKRTLYLGITDEPFASAENMKDFPKILAWKVKILDDKKVELAASHSALWQY